MIVLPTFAVEALVDAAITISRCKRVMLASPTPMSDARLTDIYAQFLKDVDRVLDDLNQIIDGQRAMDRPEPDDTLPLLFPPEEKV